MIEVPLYDYEVPSKTRQCRGVCSAIPKGMLCDDAFCWNYLIPESSSDPLPVC